MWNEAEVERRVRETDRQGELCKVRLDSGVRLAEQEGNRCGIGLGQKTGR